MVDAIVTDRIRCILFARVLKLKSLVEWTPQRTRGNPPQDIIVFVIGGGNYVEYQNIVDYGKSKGLTRITYGCTELVNPKQFVEQKSSKISELQLN
ncbi:unnamed protein product [Onchocerca flexuosa]|uniref:Sec1 family protein n=1 Tax=Onchocerca flexuosa TaxID=387005 RepID=A0A183HNB8_9BILA|nr:unnamed protein product [Onchocerca flexuosa]